MVCFRHFLFLFISCIITSSYASNPHSKFYKNFWHPTYLSERLDYCTLDGNECGKAVANRYCRLLGYEYANHHVIAYNVGLTHYLGTRAQCTGWRCNGFMTINCAKHMSHDPPKSYHYTEKRFEVPRYNDYRVDWCYDLHHGCGFRAAQSFCARMGFMRAKHYIKQTHISATKAIGSQELCFGPDCTAFKVIVCRR